MWGQTTDAGRLGDGLLKCLSLGEIVPENKKKRCSNELLAKWRKVPSLITVNIALSMAVEQERQRQDGCAGLKAACFSLCPSASIFRLMELANSSSIIMSISFIQAQNEFSLFSLAFKELYSLINKTYPLFHAYGLSIKCYIQ